MIRTSHLALALTFGAFVAWTLYIFYIDVRVLHNDQYPMEIKYLNVMDGKESWLLCH